MARTSARLADGQAALRVVSGALGPAVLCAAALAVPLAYAPSLNSVFAEPKLALLYLAGAFGLAGQILVWASPPPARARLSRGLGVAVLALVATTVLASIAALVRGAPGAPYAVAELARLLAVVGVAFAAAQATVDPRWLRRLLTSIHVAGGLVSIIGLLQHLQILPLAIPTISVPGSTFGNRNVAAEAVAMSIPFGLGWLALLGWAPRTAGDARPESPIAIVVLLAFELIYLAATRTRGAWLGAAGGLVVFYALRRRAVPRAALVVAVALGAAALAAALIPMRRVTQDSADAKRFEPGEHVVSEALDPTSPVVRTRLGLWRRTLDMYRAHPWLGVGPGNFVVMFPLYAEPGARADGVQSPSVVPRRAHQDLLERLAETGPLGLAALLAIYLAAGRIALRRARRADQKAPESGVVGGAGAGAGTPLSPQRQQQAALAAAGAGSLTALFACGLTGFPLAMPGTALLLGIALGVLASEGTVAAPAPPGENVGPRAAARTVVAVAVALALLLVAARCGARMLARSYWLARARVALSLADRPGGGPARALEALRRAERADPGRFEVALETAHVLVRLDRSAQALRAADRALAIEPHSANAWAWRAEADLGAGDARQAAVDADRATAILHDFPDALATRARAGDRSGDLAGARAARDQLAALAADGDDHAAQLFGALGPGRVR